MDLTNLNGLWILKVDMIQAVAFAVLTYYFGTWLKTKIQLLRRLSVSSPVVGGIIVVQSDAIKAFLGVESEAAILSLGSLMAFMTLSRNFNMPINQISQQLNSIIMALAGAERIFDLMDQEPEADNGYVSLVNAEISEDGTITETEKHTGHWAWKHPHGDGTLTYTELKGDIVMDMVDFSYVPEKQVLTDITLYAHPGQKIAFVGDTGAGILKLLTCGGCGIWAIIDWFIIMGTTREKNFNRLMSII